MHINFIQQECPLCGRYVSKPNFSRHHEACERKRAAIEAERVQQERLVEQ